MKSGISGGGEGAIAVEGTAAGCRNGFAEIGKIEASLLLAGRLFAIDKCLATKPLHSISGGTMIVFARRKQISRYRVKLDSPHFGQRRKTAVNSLSAGLSLPKERVAGAMAQAGLSPTVRAEQLTLSDFAALNRALFKEESE